MVARTFGKSKTAFRGARLFNPSTDINGVAHLLEEAFRPDNNFPFTATPWLREVGIALWTLNYAPGSGMPMNGMIWVEDDQIVGNVSLSPESGQMERYYLSNVSVKPEYRRQGVARALMQATLTHLREQHVTKAFLNVRPGNDSAIKLYTDLGFRSLETRGEWSINPFPLERALDRAHVDDLRPIKTSDYTTVAELVRTASKYPVRNPSEQDIFTPPLDLLITEKISDFLIGQTTRRWVVTRDNRIAAMLLWRGQRLNPPHRFVILAHADFRGRVENDLVAVALKELAKFPPHAVRAEAVTSHAELVSALERHGFVFWNGLTLMEKDLT